MFHRYSFSLDSNETFLFPIWFFFWICSFTLDSDCECNLDYITSSETIFTTEYYKMISESQFYHQGNALRLNWQVFLDLLWRLGMWHFLEILRRGTFSIDTAYHFFLFGFTGTQYRSKIKQSNSQHCRSGIQIWMNFQKVMDSSICLRVLEWDTRNS